MRTCESCIQECPTSKCPKCREGINHLVEKAKGILSYSVCLDIGKRKGKLFYDWEGCEEKDSLGFFCPQCKTLLFKSEAEAITFLKGGN